MNSSKNKIKFVQTDSHKKKKLEDKWRRPKGIQNKRRLNKRGYAPVVKSGYQSAKDEKGLIKGLLPIMINNITDLNALDNKTQGAIMANVGAKKLVLLLEEAKKLNIIVLNLKLDEKLKSLNDSFKERKDKKELVAKEKEVKDKEKKAAADKKEKEAKEKEAKEKEAAKTEETEDVDKKKLDKILTKKQ